LPYLYVSLFIFIVYLFSGLKGKDKKIICHGARGGGVFRIREGEFLFCDDEFGKR